METAKLEAIRREGNSRRKADRRYSCGFKCVPPTDAEVINVERSVDDYKWSEPGYQPRGPCQTAAALGPFWGVRRLTASTLKQSNAILETAFRKKQSFNCELQKRTVTNVCVGNVNGLSVSATRIVAVPLMTNTVQVEAGEELLMEKPDAKASESTDSRRASLEKRIC